MSVATWTGVCTGCHRDGVDVAPRRSHGERVLCATCAERPRRMPSADGLDLPAPAPSRNGASADASTTARGLRIVRASEVRVEPVQFLLADRVPLGALTLLAGDPGRGKSTWTCALAAGVTAGRHGRAATVLVANAEDSPGHVIVPRLAAAGADLERVEFFTAEATPTTERPFELPGDVPRLEAHARRVGARLVVIDPLNAHLGDAVSTKSDHSVRRALAPLAAMAQRCGVAVLVVAHLNKTAGTDALYRVGGSIGLVGGARSLLVFTADPDDPDGEDGDRRALGHAKSNWARLAATLTYEHEQVEVTVGGATVTTNRLRPVGESDVAGTALLGADLADSPATQLERAGELLADLLGDGERHRSKEIKLAAAREGIAERTLKRAAHDADLHVESEGFPKVTYWTLHSQAKGPGPTVSGPTGPTARISASTGDFAASAAQSGHTAVNGPTERDDLSDLGAEQPLADPLAAALTAQRCRCDRPLPAPDEGELRCATCGHDVDGWGGAA